MRLQVYYRRSIHCIQSPNFECPTFHRQYIDQTQPDWIGTVRTSSRKDSPLGDGRIPSWMDAEDLAICHVKPAQDKKFVSSLNAVQALDDPVVHYQVCLHTSRSTLVGSLMSFF